MISDPIADLLTRIRNGYLARKTRVRVPFSVFKEKLARILAREGFLKEVQKEDQGLVLKLKYHQGEPAVRGVKRVSKPGRRVYKKAKDIRAVQPGLGRAVISSPQGLVTDREARKKHLGGEVVCEIW